MPQSIPQDAKNYYVRVQDWSITFPCEYTKLMLTIGEILTSNAVRTTCGLSLSRKITRPGRHPWSWERRGRRWGERERERESRTYTEYQSLLSAHRNSTYPHAHVHNLVMRLTLPAITWQCMNKSQGGNNAQVQQILVYCICAIALTFYKTGEEYCKLECATA